MSLKILSHSPHIHNNASTPGIMADVIIALLPATIYGFYLFGPKAIILTLVSIATAMLSEYICCKIMKKPNSLWDLSAVVTGLLLALNVPSTLPVWMMIIGSAVAIVIVKMLFGGLGQNFANPAIVGRIVLLVSFATYMTNFEQPLKWFTGVKAATSATPLASPDSYSVLTLFIGKHPGTIGETSALLLLLGGIYLIVQEVIIPIIPVCFIGSVALFSAILGINPLVAILSGGVMLGAIFMATDYVTSPKTLLGMVIFGFGCGIITVVIRKFGSLPEGVSYSILIMNLFTPLLDKLPNGKPFGWEAKEND